jgi:two-component system, NarL family, response regulator NreC
MISPALPATDMDTITIVLADDHRMVRSALRLLLETQDDFRVVADVGDAESALARVVEHRPSVLVLDLNMPGEHSGLEALPRVREWAPDTAVVVLTMQRDPGFARRALRDGARAYVLKESADDELVEAVRTAAAGETYVAVRLREAAAGPSPAEGRGELTLRELEVLRLIALGHTNAEIAGLLTLSVRTVESHRAHIQHKLGSSRRADLVRYALDHQLLVA